MSAAYSSPATNAPASSRGPSLVCHHRFLCRQYSSAPASSSWNARFRLRYEKIRPVSSPSSAPPTSTASTFIPTSCRPSRSSRIPGIVSASTRFPFSTPAATAPVVCSSLSSTSIPIARSCSPTCARERVVVFVTKRMRWPSERRRRTAPAAPAIGVPETCRTPSTSRRMAAMDAESIRSEIAFRYSRSSGPGGQHAQKSSTRAEALFDVEESAGLSDAERKRVLAKLGPVVRAVAQDERSQLRNRELATERILEQLREATKVRRKRRPTRPTAASQERRLEDKRRRGATKRLRRAADD